MRRIASVRALLGAALLLLPLFTATSSAAAEIEFLTGNKVQGTVVSKDATSIKVQTEIGGKQVTLSYPLASIHTVTINGKRHLINEKQPAAAGASATE